MSRDIYLSMFCICGDAGAKTLGRMLKSVVHRHDGPMCDEIVIGWNGTDNKLLSSALGEIVPYHFIDLPLPRGAITRCDGFDLVIVRHEWTGDFAAARNEIHAQCRGTWVVWFDSDDVISSVSDTETSDGLKAVNAVEATYGKPLTLPSAGLDGTGTVKDFLHGLPWNVNCIQIPYDYAIGGDGRALVRQFMRRFLKRDAGWVWRSADGLHELPYPNGAVPEISLQTFGIVVRHYPATDEIDRLARNREVVTAKLEKAGESTGTVDARSAYDISTMHIGLGDWESADNSIRDAIARSNNDEDTYRYRLTRCSIQLNRGQSFYERALGEAMAASFIYPERPEAFLLMSECFYLMGDRWAACADAYERGAGKHLSPQSIDLIINRVVKSRAIAAHAYTMLGRIDRAYELGKQAIEAFPNDALAQRVFERAKRDAGKKKAVDGLMDAIEFLNSVPAAEAAALLSVAKRSVPLRGVVSLQRFQVLDAIAQHAASALGVIDPEVGDPVPQPLTDEFSTFVSNQPKDSQVIYFDPRRVPADAISVIGDQIRLARQVINYKECEDGRGIFVSSRRTSKPTITFYAPHAVGVWDPTYADLMPLGGSESAVVYLSRELASRGYPIKLHCPGGTTQPKAHKGIVWYGLHEFDPREHRQEDIVIACRSPWILRNPALVAQTWVWHQDNGYANEWTWNPEIDRRSAGSLHVSDWARNTLLAEFGETKATNHQHVIGNGVCASWGLVNQPTPPERNLRRVVYASDPTRGLETLLNCWPHVLEKVPDAELHVFADFDVISAMAVSHGIVIPATKMVADIRHKMATTPRVWSHDRVMHSELTKAMLSSSVYAYAGGPMAEGFGMSLAQASAAGMAVVFPPSGALPAVLPDHTYMLPGPVDTEAAAAGFLEVLLDAVMNAERTIDRMSISRLTLDRHEWSHVADRFERALALNREHATVGGVAVQECAS